MGMNRAGYHYILGGLVSVTVYYISLFTHLALNSQPNFNT